MIILLFCVYVCVRLSVSVSVSVCVHIYCYSTPILLIQLITSIVLVFLLRLNQVHTILNKCDYELKHVKIIVVAISPLVTCIAFY